MKLIHPDGTCVNRENTPLFPSNQSRAVSLFKFLVFVRFSPSREASEPSAEKMAQKLVSVVCAVTS